MNIWYNKKMKKIVAILMAMLMVMSVAVALAGSAEGENADATIEEKVHKQIPVQIVPEQLKTEIDIEKEIRKGNENLLKAGRVDRELVIVTPSGTEIEVPRKVINVTPVIEERLIIPAPSVIDRDRKEREALSKGCKIVHRLNDAVSVRCPPGTVMKGAKKDRIFHLMDLEADVQIGADQVWAMNPSINGTDVLVAILDTGIDATHIELNDSIVATENFVDGSSDLDEHGHGTHVSGIVTANGVYEITNDYGYTSPNYATGVAPEAGLMVGKVCGAAGCYESDIMAGIEWAVNQGADVLSLSLGTHDWHTMNENCDSDGGLIVGKVNWAVSHGVVTVISAGNEGETANGISSPGCASGAIAVGAVNKYDILAGFSNHGPALDLVAPGVGILSTYSCVAAGDCNQYWYAWMSGTSMSAPQVTGAVALILQKHPEYTVDDVKDALYETAIDLGDTGRDDYYGCGRVDAYAALKPPASITNLQNTTYAQAYINWTWNDPADIDLSHVMVYVDEELKENITKGVQYYNATGFDHDTEHTIATKTVDVFNNVNQSWGNHTARTAAAGRADLIIADTWVCWPDNYTIYYNVTNIGNGTAPVGHNTTLFVDGVEKACDCVAAALEPNESYTGCFDGYNWIYTSPDDNITVCADCYNTVAESNETNNCMFSTWKCGDVDGNGIVNILDVRLLMMHVADPTGYPVESWAGNVDGEGDDVQRLLAHVFDPEANPLNCNGV